MKSTLETYLKIKAMILLDSFMLKKNGYYDGINS
jgi:hypothetical protein